MKEQELKLVSKCGICCGTCPWGPYPRKDMTTEEFDQYKNKAKKLLGYMPIKTPCVLCQTPDAKIPKKSKLPNRRCIIRRCVDKAGVENCAYCSIFPCDTLKATAGLWNRKSIETKLGTPISEEEYQTFVEPFEGLKRLETIHASLKPEELTEPAQVMKKTRIADFPKNLAFKEKTAFFKAVHKLLSTLGASSLGLKNSDTFAQHHKLENERAHICRFLWIFGKHGKLEKADNSHLVVDAETFLSNRGKEKTLAILSFVEDIVFKILSELGVCCELVALKGVKKEDLTTGTGYLRKKGWVIKTSFKEKLGGVATIKALQTYVKKVDKKYGARGFQHFRKADMQILLET